MEYFPDTISNSLNNAFRGVGGAAKKAVLAVDEVAERANTAQKFVANQALRQLANFSPIQISVDRCNFVISVNGASTTIRNPVCSTGKSSQPVTVSYPTSPNNTCAQLNCNDGRVITTVRLHPTSIIPNTDFPNDYADAQYVCNYEYNQSVQIANELYDDVPAFCKNKQLNVGTLSSGAQQGSLPLFQIATTTNNVTTVSPDTFENDGTGHYYGNISAVLRCFYLEYDYPNGDGTYYHVKQQLGNWTVSGFIKPLCTIAPDSPPPPNIKPQECECMCNDNLLKLVLQRIGDLPATVPINLAAESSVDANGKAIPLPTQTLESIAEMIFWHVKQMDALTGQFPIPITIKGDPNAKDSKDTELALPNIAETLAEILGTLIATKRDSHAGLVSSIATLTEVGMIKNLSTQTFDISMASAEYLGYKLEQQKRTIPSMFTPNAKSITETLRPTNIDIVSYVNNDKVDLQDEIVKLTIMADRWNAQNWRSLGKTAASATAALANNLVTSPQATANVANAVKEESFTRFLTEVQQGFITTPGVTDNVDPWGTSPVDAPTVRQIGIIDVNQQPPKDASPATVKSIANSKTVANVAKLLSEL